MDPIERIREEGRKAFGSLLEDYSEEELLHPDDLLDKWQVPELREKVRKGLLALECVIPEDSRCSECGSLTTEKDCPFCMECGKPNRNFDSTLVPNIQKEAEEECGEGHPSPLMGLEPGEAAPMDFYCRLCGVQLLWKGTVPYDHDEL